MTCPETGKHAMSRSDANRTMRELAAGDPEAALLNIYKCGHCGRWHVGHAFSATRRIVARALQSDR